MTTMPQPPSDSGTATPKPLTRGEAKAVRAVAILAVTLGLIGLANSFAAVQHAVADSFGWWAWSAPLGIDIAIAIFTAMDIIHARLDMRTRWLRLAPWTLVAVTIYLNVAPEPTLVGKVAHGALPILWVVAVEVCAHTIRHRMGLASPTRMERIRRARWLLAFFSTAGLWRRMVLWEERSYTAALRRERDRLLAKAELRETYGKKWRRKAPRRTMVLLKIGELAPSALVEESRSVGALSAPFESISAPPETISAPFDAPPVAISAPSATGHPAESSYGALETDSGALIHSSGAKVRAEINDQRADSRHQETISAPRSTPTRTDEQPGEIDITPEQAARSGANGGALIDDGLAPSPPYATKKAHLKALVDALDPDDPRTNYELARNLAPRIPLDEGAARRYLGEWRENPDDQRAEIDDQRAAARNNGAFDTPPAAENRASLNGTGT